MIVYFTSYELCILFIQHSGSVSSYYNSLSQVSRPRVNIQKNFDNN